MYVIINNIFMRPQNIKTRIFLDSGDPQETKQVLSALGFLDGQTTNPSLIAKNTWIPNAHIKFPITASGLEAAHILTSEGMRVNMTLCFSQQQAAAVYVATRGVKKGDVFLSPFIGRLDDQGENGMNMIFITI